MKILIAILAGVAAAGCSTGFDRQAMNAEMDEEQPLVFDDADVLRAEQARPQLQFPIRLAVVPPTMFNRRGTGDRRETEGQRKEIMAWGDKLRDAGVVSDLFIIPELLLSTVHTQSYLKDIRIAAARLQADAVLILRSSTDVDSYANLLCALDLTFVGMFVVPAHQKDALTIVEGMVLDNRNQYVYLAGSAEGMGTSFGPLVMVDERSAVRESRIEALKAFGDLLLREGRRLRGGAPGTLYPSAGQR